MLLRLSNLGYQNHAMTVDNIDLHGRRQGRQPARRAATARTNYLTTNTVDVGPGESRDVIFTAPSPGEYLLYDRKYSYLDNGGGPGYGGMMTKIIVGAPARYRRPDRREHLTAGEEIIDEHPTARSRTPASRAALVGVGDRLRPSLVTAPRPRARPRRRKGCSATPTRSRPSR